MKESSFKGIWIPKEILLNNDLTDKEKIVLSIALCFSEDNKTCYVGNRYLAKMLNITQNRASKIVSSLQEKGYIKVKMNYYEDKNSIKNREIILIDKILKGIVKKDNRYCYLGIEGIVSRGKYIKYNNKIINKRYSFQSAVLDEWDNLYDN